MKKSEKTIVIRKATRDDIAVFSQDQISPTIRAWCLECNGEVLGLAGLAYSKGRWIGFCDLKDEARIYKISIGRAARKFMEQTRRDGVKYVYAELSQVEPRASLWLKSLGFNIDPRSNKLYRWSA